MHYEEALRKWGKQKLEEIGHKNVVEDIVTVDIDVDPGYACCGGRDPDCYCSYAEAPRCELRIRAGHGTRTFNLEYELNFSQLIKELIQVADGELTND